jgi:hypothetical protein
MKLHSLIQKLCDASGFARRAKNQILAPPILEEALRFPYGGFRWKTKLLKGSDYTVLASRDLGNWLPVWEGTAREGPIEYIDSEAFKFSYRFYRLLTGEVFSSNVLGYASVPLPPGFSLIANPFDSSESVSDIFGKSPEGTSLNKFDTRLFRLAENAIKSGRWMDPSEKLLRGEGAIFFNPTTDYKTANFVGEVFRGALSVPIPAGFSLRGSLVPRAGSLVQDLSFPISNGDAVHLFDRDGQRYHVYPYAESRWTAGEPVLAVGEAFWIAKTEPKNWIGNLVI